MNAISSKEFVTNIDKCFEIAKKNEQIFVQKDNILFAIIRVEIPEKKYKKPDDDLRRAITMEELRKQTHAVIDNFFEDK